mgnify:CR=1 FL=1
MLRPQDVSLLGHNYEIVLDGAPMYIDGTSCATPAFGGLVTLINDVRLRSGQPALGFLNPLLYVRCVGNPPLKRMGLTHWLAVVSCAGTEHGLMARTVSSTSSTATTAVLVETAAVVLALACAALRASQVRCITYSMSLKALVSCRWLWRARAAASGWDPASGLGSPVFGNLSATLLGAGYTKGSCTVDARACSQDKIQTTTNLATHGETATSVEWSASAFHSRRVLVSVTESCPSGLFSDSGLTWWEILLIVLGSVLCCCVSLYACRKLMED